MLDRVLHALGHAALWGPVTVGIALVTLGISEFAHHDGWRTGLVGAGVLLVVVGLVAFGASVIRVPSVLQQPAHQSAQVDQGSIATTGDVRSEHQSGGQAASIIVNQQLAQSQQAIDERTLVLGNPRQEPQEMLALAGHQGGNAALSWPTYPIVLYRVPITNRGAAVVDARVRLTRCVRTYDDSSIDPSVRLTGKPDPTLHLTGDNPTDFRSYRDAFHLAHDETEWVDVIAMTRWKLETSEGQHHVVYVWSIASPDAVEQVCHLADGLYTVTLSAFATGNSSEPQDYSILIDQQKGRLVMTRLAPTQSAVDPP